MFTKHKWQYVWNSLRNVQQNSLSFALSLPLSFALFHNYTLNRSHCKNFSPTHEHKLNEPEKKTSDNSNATKEAMQFLPTLLLSELHEFGWGVAHVLTLNETSINKHMPILLRSNSSVMLQLRVSIQCNAVCNIQKPLSNRFVLRTPTLLLSPIDLSV